MPFADKHDEKPRLFAKIVWELVKSGEHRTLADLTDAFKARCAKLHIAWDNDAINAAYRLIETHTPLVPPSPLVQPTRGVERLEPTGPPVSREVAARLLRELKTGGPRPMPQAPPPIDPRKADQYRALQLVMGEIAASIARAEALEAEGPGAV